MESPLRFARLTNKAIAPVRSSKKAAGYDLASAYDYIIPAGGKCLCKTDIQIAVPEGCYGRVAPRSGLASKFMIDVGAGVIDEDYRGNVMVLLFNHGSEEFKVQAGDRIAQLVLERISTPEVVELASLDETERGANGFGSTGLRETGEVVNMDQVTTEKHGSPTKMRKPDMATQDLQNEDPKRVCV